MRKNTKSLLPLKKKVTKHLKGDIKGYKKEIGEDKELIRDLKGRSKRKPRK